MTFVAGQSGNPAGRRRGTSNAATSKRNRMRALIEAKADLLLEQAIEMSKTEPSVMNALLDRFVPKLKPVERESRVQLNPTGTYAEHARVLLAALANGDMSIEDVRGVSDILSKLHATDAPAGSVLNIQINGMDDSGSVSANKVALKSKEDASVAPQPAHLWPIDRDT